MILPIALAIITLVEWLRTRRVRAFLSRWSARPWTME